MSNGNGNNWGVPNRPKVSLGVSFPDQKDGVDGDVQIKQTNLGAKLFGKIGGSWYGAPLTATEGNPVTRIGVNMSDYLSIDRDSVDIYKNSVKVAEFGTTTIIGAIADDTSRIEIGGGDIKIINRQGTTDTTAIQLLADGSATFTGTLVVGGTTVTSLENGATGDQSASEIRSGTGWSHGSDATKIDGGDIYANSVTASQIAAGTITISELATIANINLSGQINITGASSSRNVVIGVNGNDLGSDNIAIGVDAGAAFTSSARQNVCIGDSAGKSIEDGEANVFIGDSAGENVQDTGNNVAIGRNALLDLGTTIGTHDGATNFHNVAVGYAALQNVDASGTGEGLGNVALGSNAGDGITTGKYNTCIGYNTDASAGATNAVIIGNGISAGNDTFRVGFASNYISATFDGTDSFDVTSDIRKKKDINDNTLGLAFLNDIKTKTFKWKPASEFPEEWKAYVYDDDGNKVYDRMNTEKLRYGLIAQEVKETMDTFEADEFPGWSVDELGIQGVSKMAFITPIIKAVQELSVKLDTMQTEINNLK